MIQNNKIVFRIQCVDQKGIIAAVSSFFYQAGFNILSCEQFTDSNQGMYYMRIAIDGNDLKTSKSDLEAQFGAFAQNYSLDWRVNYMSEKQNVAILVSKTSHCLYDILEKHSEGLLDCNIPLIIANHPDLENIANQFKIPFYCLSVTPETKATQEQQVIELLEKHHVDLIVMARYMQILTDTFIQHFPNRIINIHHAFLPAFKGANPYRRAYDRGVKMIGATAHYATADLDEGPIIDQDVERVSHIFSPKKLSLLGAEIERKVLSSAVKSHLDCRIIVTGNKTIVFPEINE